MGYIPKALLRRLYVKGSMRATGEGLSFKVKNTLITAQVDAPIKVQVDGNPVRPEDLTILLNGQPYTGQPSPSSPLEIPVGAELEFRVKGPYSKGKHRVSIEVSVKGYGTGTIEFEDEAQ